MNQVLQRVADVEGVQHAHAEIDGELQSRLAGSAAVDAFLLSKRRTRKPSKPAFCRAKRYSASYMPKRQGPQEPAVKNTWSFTMSSRDMPCFSRPCRFCTRLPTVKYVGLHWPLLPNSCRVGRHSRRESAP